MSTFTTIPKNPLSWQTLPNSNIPSESVFTHQSKNPLSPNAPAVTSTENYYLLISDLYFLDIGNDKKLTIQDNGARENITWNTENKRN